MAALLLLHVHYYSQNLKDWALAFLVLFLVVIDVVILTTYTIAEGVRGHFGDTTRIPNRENEEDSTGVS